MTKYISKFDFALLNFSCGIKTQNQNQILLPNAILIILIALKLPFFKFVIFSN